MVSFYKDQLLGDFLDCIDSIYTFWRNTISWSENILCIISVFKNVTHSMAQHVISLSQCPFENISFLFSLKVIFSGLRILLGQFKHAIPFSPGWKHFHEKICSNNNSFSPTLNVSFYSAWFYDFLLLTEVHMFSYKLSYCEYCGF